MDISVLTKKFTKDIYDHIFSLHKSLSLKFDLNHREVKEFFAEYITESSRTPLILPELSEDDKKLIDSNVFRGFSDLQKYGGESLKTYKSLKDCSEAKSFKRQDILINNLCRSIEKNDHMTASSSAIALLKTGKKGELLDVLDSLCIKMTNPLAVYAAYWMKAVDREDVKKVEDFVLKTIYIYCNCPKSDLSMLIIKDVEYKCKKEKNEDIFDDLFEEYKNLLNSQDVSDAIFWKIVRVIKRMEKHGDDITDFKFDVHAKTRDAKVIDEEVEYESLFSRKKKNIYKVWHFLIEQCYPLKRAEQIQLRMTIALLRRFNEDKLNSHLVHATVSFLTSKFGIVKMEYMSSEIKVEVAQSLESSPSGRPAESGFKIYPESYDYKVINTGHRSKEWWHYLHCLNYDNSELSTFYRKNIALFLLKRDR